MDRPLFECARRIARRRTILPIVAAVGILTAEARAASLTIRPPHDWAEISMDAPGPAESEHVRRTSFHAWGPDGRARLAIVCHETEVDGYTEEADGFVRERLMGVASSLADRLGAGEPLHVTSTTRGDRATRFDAEGSKVRARAAFGFEARGGAFGLASCVAVCAAPECAASIGDARLAGALVDAPGPTLAMRASGVVLRHPRGAALAAILAACVAGGAAIATRKRPKTRASR